MYRQVRGEILLLSGDAVLWLLKVRSCFL